MQIYTRFGKHGDVPVLFLADELDIASHSQLRKALDELATQGTYVLVDMRDVAFIDSSALGLFLALNRNLAQRHGLVAFTAPSYPVRRIFEVTGMNGCIQVFDDLDTAAQYMAKLGGKSTDAGRFD